MNRIKGESKNFKLSFRTELRYRLTGCFFQTSYFLSYGLCFFCYKTSFILFYRFFVTKKRPLCKFLIGKKTFCLLVQSTES